MPQPLERIGRPASPGIAVGPLAPFSSVVRPIAAATTDAAAARARLTQALAAAARSWQGCSAAAEPDGQAILEFQIAMLEDGTFSDAALALIEGGASAAAGWSAALDGEIAGFADAGDDYFRARAGDLADLRDRVLRRLAGEADAVLPAGLDPDWRRPRTEPVPGDRLEPGWRRHPGRRGSPLSHVAILARARADAPGRRSRRSACEGSRRGARSRVLDADAGQLTCPT